MSATIQADTIIGQKYRIGVKIGSGSFGEIYSGTLISDEPGPPPQVAIKFEKKAARCPQLRHEFKVYRELQGCSGIGRVMYFGSYRDCNVMVMELLGPSLEDLFNTCGRRFSLRTTLQIADQLLERAETLHENHLIHRDIKPANFVANLQVQTSNALVFCIDFGLSKRYRHPHTMQHIPYREGRSLTGTPRYASIANHLGIEQSRRDDLEAIGYVLVYFAKGRLPWQGLKAKSAHKKYALILEKKQAISIRELCEGCPPQFAEYLAYCRELKFDAQPNVAYLRRLFRDLYAQQGHDVQQLAANDWDWTTAQSPHDAAPQHASSTHGSQGGNRPPAASAAPPPRPQHHDFLLGAQPSSAYGAQPSSFGAPPGAFAAPRSEHSPAARPERPKSAGHAAPHAAHGYSSSADAATPRAAGVSSTTGAPYGSGAAYGGGTAASSSIFERPRGAPSDAHDANQRVSRF
mmetsp:Transcript_31835/g.109504  ORF Transcript_31835/g.109504 Transcript_31835/m.109504 type:complete len:462 (+) Transcript_31835:80-1465(+)